jgi:Xaa-Pro dipeptidase
LIKYSQRLWPTPLYADFPRSEYEDRVARVRKYMEEAKIDILVLWDPLNIRYFSGFQSLHWSAVSIQSAVYLLPLDKDPVIVVPDFFAGVVEGYTYLTDTRLQPLSHLTEAIRSLPTEVADVVKELGCGKARIGLESGRVAYMYIPRPVNDIDRFRSELDGATFVDAADVIWKCRMIKSAGEVEAIKKATQAVVRAYGELAADFRPGMSEREVARMIRHAILEYTEDCEPMIATASSRKIPMPDTPSFYDEVTLSIGDRIAIEPLPTYKGYRGSCARVFQIGPLPEEALRKSEACDRVQAIAFGALKPGMTVGALLDVILEACKDHGIPTVDGDMAGHGIGLSLHEPPMLSPKDETLIEEGMVLAVEVWMVDWSGKSVIEGKIVPEVYGNEDLAVVTKSGCDQLPSFRREIRSLPYEGSLL